jgi:hypothetical protein
MKYHTSLRLKLNAARAQLAVAVAEAAVSDGKVGEDIKQLEAYEKLLAVLPRSMFREMYPAILIAGACLLAISVAWTIRMRTTRIHLETRTNAVSMRLAAPLAWEGTWRVGSSVVRLQEFSKLELPPELGTFAPLTERAWLEITGGTIKLTRLDFSQDALVSINRNESGQVEVLTLDKTFQGQLDVAGTPRISAGSSPESSIHLLTATFDPPGTVTFYDAGRPGIPARLRVSPLENVELRRLPIRSLSLFTETTNAEQESSFSSGITTGEMTLSDTGEAVELKEGDPLYLNDAKGLVSALVIGPDALQLSFDGEVHGVSVGPRGFERNLKPTLLEYLYHQKKLTFFWSGVTFLWGLIWSGRRLFSA